MNSRTKIILALAAVALSLSLTLVSFSSFVQAPKPFYGFYVIMPSIVQVAPGNQTLIHGGVQNFGFYWEHNVVVNVTGLPAGFEATAVPDFFENLRTLRDWNPQQGLYYVPENLDIAVKVPAGATPGLYSVNVSLVDMQSARHPANSTVFILQVSGQAPTQPISISDISVPDTVAAFKPFNISFSVINNVTFNQSVNLTVQIPQDWNATPTVISDVVPASSSKSFFFTITPTNSSGSFSVALTYPYQGVVLNVTKTGPFLTVGGTSGLALPSLPKITLPQSPMSGSAVSSVAAFASANPLITVVVVVVAAVLIYYFYSTYTVSGSRKKPEEPTKQMKQTNQAEISELKTEIIGKE